MPTTAPETSLLNNSEHVRAVSLFVICAVLVVLFPGALVGAGLAFVIWQVTRTDFVTQWLLAGLCAAAASAAIAPNAPTAWPWQLLNHAISPTASYDVSASAVIAAIPAQALLGPLILLAFQLGLMYRRRTIHGQEWSRYMGVEARKKALEHGWLGPGRIGAQVGDQRHPPGQILLGTKASTRDPFHLGAEEIAQHVFTLANGHGVVIVDCKGLGLGAEARKLAARHQVGFTAVNPDDPESVGYDPCSGAAATIANKLVGAFSFSGEAEIYKQVAMEVIPVICRAMDAAGKDITLDAIYDALDDGGLSRLGRAKGAEPYQERLDLLDDSRGIGRAGYLGFQKRLGALMEGTFGELFRQRPVLDWKMAMAQPSVVYVSLSTTAAGEDVELFGRVITNDLKQVCAQRMRAIEQGEEPIPVLVIYDEFAALREATQITDLLLQARQARCPLVVATQFLPQDPTIRQPALSAGVLIVHRLEATDAEIVAAQFGTHTTTELTAQLNYDLGTSDKGSVRWVEEFNVHPNELKSLPIGTAAVYARKSDRRQLVQVQRMS